MGSVRRPVRIVHAGAAFSLLLLLLVEFGWTASLSPLSAPQASQEDSSEENLGPPQTRAEMWRQRRLEKAASNMSPEELTGFEAAMLKLEKGEFLTVNYKDVYPTFSTIAIGAGFSPGVRFWKPDIARSGWDLQASGAFSFRGYRQYGLQFGRSVHSGIPAELVPSGELGLRSVAGQIPAPKKFFIYGNLRYSDLPQEDFFGLGPSSRSLDRTDYRLESALVEAVSGYRFNPWLSVSFHAGLEDFKVRTGTDGRFPSTEQLFDERQAPGLLGRPDFFRWTAAVFADGRDRPGNPHQGGVYSFAFSRFDQRDGDDFKFNRYAFDARQFVPIGSVQRVLALHLFASIDDADENSRVPFFLQHTLGGINALRGFSDFRFRDVNLLLFSAEYRWEAAPAVEFALFWDAGKVFADRSRFDLQDLEKTYGGGVRFKTSQSVLFRVEISRSPEGTRLALALGPSF